MANTILYNSFGTHGQSAVSQYTQFYDCPHNYIISSACLGLLWGWTKLIEEEMNEIVKSWSSRPNAELCHSNVTCWPSAGAEFEVLYSAGADSLANALAVVTGEWGWSCYALNRICRLHARIFVCRIQAGVNARTRLSAPTQSTPSGTGRSVNDCIFMTNRFLCSPSSVYLFRLIILLAIYL